MKKALFTLFIMTISLYAQTITLAVAANVSYAIDELKREFLKTHPNTTIKVILGSSGKLTAQIVHGAPYGLFMSANMKYPQFLYERKLTLHKPRVYAKGSLALLSLKKRDFSKGIHVLKEENIHKIAIANPKTAPYGVASAQALKRAGLYDELKSKFIFGESIAQTVSYTVTATDIGIIASSSLYSLRMKHFKEKENWVLLDKSLYTPIEQGIVLLKKAKDIKSYQEFYDFIFSPKGRAILKTYGYTI